MTIPYIVGAVIVFLYVFYKLKLENRYSWKQFNNKDIFDPEGVPCSRIIFTDKQAEGLQIEYLYEIKLDAFLVESHIASKNRAHRRNILKRYTNK